MIMIKVFYILGKLFSFFSTNPANIYLFKVNNRNTSKKSEICSKSTIKTPERRHGSRYVNASWECLKKHQ